MRRGIAYLAASGVLLAVALASVHHVFGVGLDFYSAVWLPGHVLLHGGDPYRLSVMARATPRGRPAGPFPVYGPPHLALAAVAALLPLRIAAAVWGALSLAMIGLIGAISARVTTARRAADPLFWSATAAITAVLILSRPGRDALDLGQPSLFYILTTMAAWHFRDRPWIGGFAVAITVGKPPFAIPLVLILIVARCWPALVRAAAIGAVISAPVLAAASVDEGSFSAVLQAIRQNATYFQDHFTVTGTTRIEAASLIDRVTATQTNAASVGLGVLVLALGLVVLEQARRRAAPETGPLLTVLALTAILAVAHQDYDLLLLAVPVAALVRDRWQTVVAASMLPAVVVMLVPARTAARILHTGPGAVLGLTTALLLAALVTILLTCRTWLRPGPISPVSAPAHPLPFDPVVGSAAR